jgi:hypothetical protein
MHSVLLVEKTRVPPKDLYWIKLDTIKFVSVSFGGTLVFSTNKTECIDITEILLKWYC